MPQRLIYHGQTDLALRGSELARKGGQHMSHGWSPGESCRKVAPEGSHRTELLLAFSSSPDDYLAERENFFFFFFFFRKTVFTLQKN